MGISDKGFTGYSSEDFSIGYKKSKRWKDGTSEALNGDYKEIIASEVPTVKHNPTMTEVSRIQRKKRNPVNIVGADGVEMTIKQLLNSNFLNVYSDLVQSTVGKIQDIDSLATTSPVNIENEYTITFGSVADAQRVFTGGIQAENHLVAFFNASGVLVDMDFPISRDGAIVTFAGQLELGSNFTAVKLPSIDFDDTPDQLLDFLVLKASGYDYTDNPAYKGSKAVKVINCLGSATFDFPLQQNGTVEYNFMGDSMNYLNPEEVRSPILFSTEITTNIQPTDIHINYIKDGQLNSLTVEILVPTDIDAVATAIKSELDSTTTGITTTIVGSKNLSISSADPTFDVNIFIDGSLLLYTKEIRSGLPKAHFEWQNVNKEYAIQGGIENFIGINSTNPVVRIGAGLNHYPGEEYEVIINGISLKFQEADDGTGLESLPVAYSELNGYEELDFVVTYDNSTTEAVITGNSNSQLNVLMKRTTGGDVLQSITVEKEADGDKYNDEAPFVKFDKVFIGEAGVNMQNWCEAMSISLEYTRDVKEIRSLCGSQGRKGWFNRDYTLYLNIEATDVDAKRVYEKWEKYKNNKVFSLLFIDYDSKLSMFFPACRFEEKEGVDLEGITGHRYKINVNFRADVKPIISLPQAI